VEDDESVRLTAVDLLTELGYRVLQARDADAAVAVLESGQPLDLLFTDVIMPGSMTSTELARRARARWPGMAVLFTSGFAENASARNGRLERGVDLLVKPYSGEALARKARQVLADQPLRNPATGGAEHAAGPT
jgi:CheY-like chemotaxis protein